MHTDEKLKHKSATSRLLMSLGFLVLYPAILLHQYLPDSTVVSVFYAVGVIVGAAFAFVGVVLCFQVVTHPDTPTRTQPGIFRRASHDTDSQGDDSR